jgi:hypothetical protein
MGRSSRGMKRLRDDERELTGKHGGKRWIAVATRIRPGRFAVEDIRVEAVSDHWVHLGMMGDATFTTIAAMRAGIEGKVEELNSLFPEDREAPARAARPDDVGEVDDEALFESGVPPLR